MAGKAKKEKDSALQALRWAVPISAGLLGGGLLLFCLSAWVLHVPLAGMTLLCAAALAVLVLLFAFVPAARQEAIAKSGAEREAAVVAAFRGKFTMLTLLCAAAVLAFPLFPGMEADAQLSASAYFSLLPALICLIGIAVYIASRILRRRLFTASQRAAAAAAPLPRAMNLGSLLLILAANLSAFLYRFLWVTTGFENDVITVIALVAFALFYVLLLFLPLIAGLRRKGREARRMVFLSAVRNLLIAIGALMANFAIVFTRVDDVGQMRIDAAPFCIGIVLAVGAAFAFRLLLLKKKAQ